MRTVMLSQVLLAAALSSSLVGCAADAPPGDEAPLIEKVNDPAGTNSPQPWLWRSNAASVECATSYAAIATSTMLKVVTKAITCEPLGFGEHTCGVAAGWILFHRNDTANWSGKNPCGLKMVTGGTPAAPTSSGLVSLWLR